MGNSGGAATNSGIDFQQRIAAYVMTCHLCGIGVISGIDSIDASKLKELRFETNDEIDDLVALGNDFRVLIQAKRSLSISDSIDSEFSSVIAQFVRQYLSDNRQHDAYVLAVSPKASSRVRRELRKLTESVRLNEIGAPGNPHTEAEYEVLEKTQGLIREHFGKQARRAIRPYEATSILSRIHVAVLDIETGGALESAAMMLLNVKTQLDPKTLWGALISLALSLAKDRLSISDKSLRERMGKFITESSRDTRDFLTLGGGRFASGREVIIADYPEENNKIIVAELIRFDPDGKKRLKFSDGKLHFSDDYQWNVLRRFSTATGAQNYLINEMKGIRDTEIILAPINSDEDYDELPYAQAHSEYCEAQLRSLGSAMYCLHCGEAVSEDLAPVIEIDEVGEPARVGVVHRDCVRPLDRTMGHIQSTFFRKYQRLKTFDYATWLRTVQRGQGAFARPINKIGFLGWKSEYDDFSKGNWCIRVILEDGSAQYITERARVLRASKSEAERLSADFNKAIEKAKEDTNPLCYSDSGDMYGAYSTILEEGGNPVQCVYSTAIKFTQSIDAAYSLCDSFYAPLAYLSDSDTGKPVTLNGEVVPLLTNPLLVEEYVTNWQKAGGMELPDYVVSIIENDDRFDRFVRLFMGRGIAVAVDPKWTLRRDLASGYVVQHFESFVGGSDA
ncbi:hypothetical protein ACFY5K_33630 [Streptomyces griseofuscus]|uniref:hypothetical protein n=1 Tax=Streptomyces griseofuscus TaxID=146922 RepID=UPI0036924984